MYMTIYYQKGIQGAAMQPIPNTLDDFSTLLRANPVQIEAKDKVDMVKIGSQEMTRAKGQKALYFISGYLKNDRRNNENLISRNLLIADIDEGIESVEGLHERLNDVLKEYSFYLYPSTSFTETDLKFRLVLDSERAMTEQEYMATLKEVERILDIDFDDKSYTWSQMMGLPITDDPWQFKKVSLINQGKPYPVVSSSEPTNTSSSFVTATYRATGYKGKIPKLLEEVYKGIENGERNVFFTRAYGTLIRANVSPAIAIEIVRDWNARFTNPPINDNELAGIIKSVNDREKKKVIN